MSSVRSISTSSEGEVRIDRLALRGGIGDIDGMGLTRVDCTLEKIGVLMVGIISISGVCANEVGKLS